MRVGTSVWPRSVTLAARRSISRRCASSLPRALGVVVLARGGRVGRDVNRMQPQLALAQRGVAVLELRAGLAQRLDLGALAARCRTPGARAARSDRRRSGWRPRRRRRSCASWSSPSIEPRGCGRTFLRLRPQGGYAMGIAVDLTAREPDRPARGVRRRALRPRRAGRRGGAWPRSARPGGWCPGG